MFIFSGDDEKQLFCLFDMGLEPPFLEAGELIPESFLLTLMVVEIGEPMDGVLDFLLKPIPDVLVLILVRFLLLNKFSRVKGIVS